MQISYEYFITGLLKEEGGGERGRESAEKSAL